MKKMKMKKNKKYYGKKKAPGASHFALGLVKDGLLGGLEDAGFNLISFYYDYALYKLRELRRKNQEAQE